MALTSVFISLSHCFLLRRDSCWDHVRFSEIHCQEASESLALTVVGGVWLLGPEVVVSLSSQDQRELMWRDRLLEARRGGRDSTYRETEQVLSRAHAVIYSLNRHLLSTCCIPISVRDTRPSEGLNLLVSLTILLRVRELGKHLCQNLKGHHSPWHLQGPLNKYLQCP